MMMSVTSLKVLKRRLCNRLIYYFLSKVDFSTSPSLLQGELHILTKPFLLEERGCNRPQCCFSKIIPSFFTIKEGSTSHLGLLPSGKKRKTALRCSEPLRSKVGGASKPSPGLCGLGPPKDNWRSIINVYLSSDV